MGSTRQEVLLRLNEILRECRPLGHVKAILKSPNREKELMVTLNVTDKERLDDDDFFKMLASSQPGKKGSK